MVRNSLFYCCIFASLLVLCFSRYSHGISSEPSACTQCMNNKSCVAPHCFCCRDELRLPISIKDIPQIVFFTFDDALTDSATKFYNQLFNASRKNPNGCPVSMTLFVSHHDTVYSNVNYMYRKGMEIAAHSVSHAHMKNDNFMQEAQNQKRNLATLGGVPENEIVGWRSPFLEPVGDMQPSTLKKLGYTYDATLTYSKRALKDKAPTPFTLDFGWPYDCKVKPCPQRRHFGFWEVPVVSLLDYLHKYDCVYVDGCNNPPPDENSAFNFLMDNFNSYYTKHRVPFGINMHPSWFYIPERLNAMDRFIRKLSNMDDVYIVSVKKMIDWLKNPTGLSQIHSFKPWQCRTQQSQHSTHNSRANKRQNVWNRPTDPRVQKQNSIKARLEKIRQMRQQSNHAYSKDMKRMQQSAEARKRWWVRDSFSDNTQSSGQQKPAAIAPWVHRKHDRPIKTNARRPSMVLSGSKTSKDVPFWKRENKKPSNDFTVKRNRQAAWWEKAIPKPKSTIVKVNTQNQHKHSAKISFAHDKHHNVVHSAHFMRKHNHHKNPTRELALNRNTFASVDKQKEEVSPTAVKPLLTRNTFNSKLPSNQNEKVIHKVVITRKVDDNKRHKEIKPILSRNTFNVDNKKEKNTNKGIGNVLNTPPKVDFAQQLKEQELKQLEIIEKQKKMQEEQLRLQIKKLKDNNKEVYKRQQMEEEKRRREIEQKHSQGTQKSANLIINQDKHMNSVEASMTTVPQNFMQIATTLAPQKEKFSLFPDKNSKLDPWTRFVQFIMRNKP